MPGYTPTGPWTNNAAPGIQASFLNNLENWIQQTEGDTGANIVSGSTSGTATLYQFFQGTYKYVFIVVSSSYNSTLKTIALPVAFTTRAFLRTKNNPGPMRFLASGSPVNMFMVTGFNSTTGAETTSAAQTSTTAGSGQQGQIAGAFDTVELSATGAVGPATIIIEGS